jgi:hypothetical protein
MAAALVVTDLMRKGQCAERTIPDSHAETVCGGISSTKSISDATVAWIGSREEAHYIGTRGVSFSMHCIKDAIIC